MVRGAATRALIPKWTALALVAVALVSLQERAATLKIGSQNTLRLSDSQRQAAKRLELQTQAGKFDLYTVQEAMKNITFSSITPGTHAFQFTDPKGQTSYKERYAVVYNTALTPQNGTADKKMVDYGGTKKFARPPSGTMFKDGSGNFFWYIDFHAVFGKSVTERRDEAKYMADVYTWFKTKQANGQTTDKIIIAGDWNLGATDSGFATIKALNKNHMKIIPDVKTSLTQAAALSEPYDHFVVDDTKITLGTCKTIPLPTGKDIVWFRNNISDHLGIQCVATVLVTQ